MDRLADDINVVFTRETRLAQRKPSNYASNADPDQV